MAIAAEAPLKTSEAGLIPQDWHAARLMTISERITVGFVGSMSHLFCDNGVPLLRGQNVLPNQIDLTDTRYISPDTNKLWRKSALHAGDVVIVRVGYPGTACVIPDDFGDANAASLVVVTPRTKRLRSNYLAYVLNSDIGKKQIRKALVGGAQQVFNTTTAGEFVIALPDVREQDAITEALSDADAYIESLEQLLAKKRAVMQGAMQELLTGKRRLPGFSGEWRAQNLGAIANIKTGDRNTEDRVEGGKYPFYIRSAQVQRINTYSHDCEAILVPGEGGIGSIFHYVHGRFAVHQRVYAITQFAADAVGKFIYYYMKIQFGAHAMEHSVKATVDSLRLPTFQNFVVMLPPDKDEQYAIATVLSDMDSEIACLEQKIEKARDIKEGLMQELLTGRVRLV